MNQKTKYIGMLAIIPLVMVAIVPNYIGEADALNQHFVAIEKLRRNLCGHYSQVFFGVFS